MCKQNPRNASSLFITAHKREGNVFTRVCLFTGGVSALAGGGGSLSPRTSTTAGGTHSTECVLVKR